MMGWDPWADVDIEIVEGPIRHVRAAYLPDIPAIVLSSGLREIERRSALAHELGHHSLGHRPHPDPAETARMELRAQRWAAVKLLSLEDLAAGFRGADNLFDMAEELGVDPELLEVRLRWLTDQERTTLKKEWT